MPSRRDRHDRGLRGPLVAGDPLQQKPPLSKSKSKPARFALAIESALDQISQHCPDALIGVQVGFEDVPTPQLGWDNRVPLGVARSATSQNVGQIVLYRRVIERRCQDQDSLENLVLLTLVEQLSAITGYSVTELNPDIEPD
ncbi:MAG: metallopeptidase family protein [Propionibacteriaceae bacterium]|nr:metallopeptidase family protein [Propionibacteriaceae bacterium]